MPYTGILRSKLISYFEVYYTSKYELPRLCLRIAEDVLRLPEALAHLFQQ